MSDTRTLVVGTTPDYIDWLRNKFPGQLLFITDRRIRHLAKEIQPGSKEEILSNLKDPEKSRFSLLDFLHTEQLELDGIVCFDCESLPLAALLAHHFGLQYTTLETIRNCRDKHLAKTLWQRFGVCCPQTRLLQSLKDVDNLNITNNRSWVLKPACGSGSELVYHCRCQNEIESSFRTLSHELKKRTHLPLYYNQEGEPAAIVGEEYIPGTEYSADFFLTEKGVKIIRLTEKIKRPGYPFGTIRGYCLINSLGSAELDKELRTLLDRGCHALGLEQSLCMVDFIVHNDQVVLLEVTPRPGGDCLPALLRAAGPLDILELAVNFARRKEGGLQLPQQMKKFAALRFHAEQGGIIRKIDAQKVFTDPRTRECHLLRKTGDRICMPPQDYDSWLLGYLIFQPREDENLDVQCHNLHQQLTIEIEP